MQARRAAQDTMLRAQAAQARGRHLGSGEWGPSRGAENGNSIFGEPPIISPIPAPVA